MPTPLTIVNADTATFDCIFGRGCEGICCKNGRPSVDPAENKQIADHLDKFLPHLRPEARALVESDGYLSKRTKLGQPMVRVVGGWCVFFNAGCVLHKVGLEDGDFTRYKPSQCVLFPLERGDDGNWFVRQWGYGQERWDIFCLNPKQTKKKAVDTMAAEIAYAVRVVEDEQSTKSA
jgi:hypothetical protein